MQAPSRQHMDLPTRLLPWPQPPWLKRCCTQLLPPNRVFMRDLVGLHPQSQSQGVVCNQAQWLQRSRWMYLLVKRPKKLLTRYHWPSRRCPRNTDKSKEVYRCWRVQWRRYGRQNRVSWRPLHRCSRRFVARHR